MVFDSECLQIKLIISYGKCIELKANYHIVLHGVAGVCMMLHLFQTFEKPRKIDQSYPVSWKYILVLVIGLQDVSKASCKKVFKKSSKCLQDVFKTSSRHLDKTFSRRLQNVFTTSSKHLQDVFKMYHQVKLFVLNMF